MIDSVKSEKNLSENEEIRRDVFSQEIINLEFLEYYVYKISDIYHYKDFVLIFPDMEKQIKNLNRYKVLRNICLVLLYLSLIFTKPDWCDKKELDILKDCSKSKADDIEYFTLMPVYMDLYNFEILSWFLMLVLIVFDLFMFEIKSRIILVFCILYFTDIITGFFYMNDVLSVKFNTLIRLAFLIFYARYTRITLFTLIKFIYKIRKLYYLYFCVVIVFGVVLNILYFDTEDENNDLLYNKLDFSSIKNSIFSSYTIITLQNTLNLFSFTLINQPFFIILLIPIFFTIIFILMTFIIAMMTYFYSKIIRENVRFIPYYTNGFKKIFYYFKNNKGIVKYQKLGLFIDDFFKDPSNVDFEKFEDFKNNKKKQNKELRYNLKDFSYFSIYYKEFREVRNNPLYKSFYILIDTFIFFIPILILNNEQEGLNSRWYLYSIFIAGLSTIDPFLFLIFSLHKITSKRKLINIFKIVVAVCIILMALFLGTRKREVGQSIAQSNDIMFFIFSFFCFMKIITFVDVIILRNKILYTFSKIIFEFIPFFVKIFTIYFILILFYSFVGRILFGGLINSNSIDSYESKGFLLRHRYEYFNFNDILGSFLTLFVLNLQNNWIYVTEFLYFVRNDIFTTIFIVSFNVLVSFTLTSLIIGVISKLICLYFEKDLDHIKKDIEKQAYSDIISHSDFKEANNNS
jgi:hypothetical protein